jgi:GMP synthase-like glutamine amidotransferase
VPAASTDSLKEYQHSMKPIVILQQGEDSPPDTIGRVLDEGGYDWQVRRLWVDEPLPQSPGDVAALIVLGGAMHAHQEDEYPFLKGERALMRQALNADLPLLGICLGGELLAEVAGGHIYERATDELGWVPVDLIGDDPLLAGITAPLLTFEWHSDSFTLPPAATPLAARTDGLQAFRLGQAWGLQFHPEVELDTVLAWVADERDVLERRQPGLAAELSAQTRERMPAHRQICGRLLKYWLAACGLTAQRG